MTGASRGLGAAVAAELRRRGATLLLTGSDESRLRERVRQLESIPSPAGALHIVAADLAQPDSPERIAACARDRLTRVDALVNNAAIQGPIGELAANDWGQWQRTIQVNLLAPVALCRLIAPGMRDAGGGSIVNLSGGGATSPRPNFSAYASAKAALARFTETLAAEMEPHRVRVNAVAPGALQTDMLAELLAAGPEAAGQAAYQKAQQCRDQGGDSIERAAALIAMLISPAGAPITGRLLSAVWDPWEDLPARADQLRGTDLYTLRRVTPSGPGTGGAR